MEQSDASLQRGLQGSCTQADVTHAPVERGRDLPASGHSRDHPLQVA
jgi:hypothetical protein